MEHIKKVGKEVGIFIGHTSSPIFSSKSGISVNPEIVGEAEGEGKGEDLPVFPIISDEKDKG